MRAVQTICYDLFSLCGFFAFRLSYTKPFLLNGIFDWRYLPKPISFRQSISQKHTIHIIVCINICRACTPVSLKDYNDLCYKTVFDKDSVTCRSRWFIQNRSAGISLFRINESSLRARLLKHSNRLAPLFKQLLTGDFRS